MKSVTLIDCEYTFPRYAGAYLVVNNGKAAFVDNNTTHSVPRLMAALQTSGLCPEDVAFIIITHVHLDHAGGTSALLSQCPNATVLAHPRAAPHVIDPTKLVASARAVYGNEKFKSLYGEIHPIPSSRVQAMGDAESIPFGDGALTFLHTRGHANHHFCILYRSGEESAIFTGDSFGIAYPVLQTNGLFLFPSTSPTDFISDEAIKSVDRIIASGASEALLTHFGSVHDFPSARQQMVESIRMSQVIIDEAVVAKLSGEAIEKFCLDRVRAGMKVKAKKQDVPYTSAVEALLSVDLDLNAQGLAHVVRKTLNPK